MHSLEVILQHFFHRNVDSLASCYRSQSRDIFKKYSQRPNLAVTFDGGLINFYFHKIFLILNQKGNFE